MRTFCEFVHFKAIVPIPRRSELKGTPCSGTSGLLAPYLSIVFAVEVEHQKSEEKLRL